MSVDIFRCLRCGDLNCPPQVYFCASCLRPPTTRTAPPTVTAADSDISVIQVNAAGQMVSLVGQGEIPEVRDILPLRLGGLPADYRLTMVMPLPSPTGQWYGVAERIAEFQEEVAVEARRKRA